MTTEQFNALIIALRDVMEEARQDPDVMEADDERQRIRLPLPRNAWQAFETSQIIVGEADFNARAAAEELYHAYQLAYGKADGLPLVRCVGGPADGMEVPLAEIDNSYLYKANGVRHAYHRNRDPSTGLSVLRTAEDPGRRL